MVLRRRWSRLFAWLCLGAALLAVGLLYGQHRWQQYLHAQGIDELSWQGLRLASSGPALRHLQLERQQSDGSRLRLNATYLALGWPARTADGLWHLPSLHIQRVGLERTEPSGASGNPPAADIQQMQTLVASLPRHFDIDAFRLDLPCASGLCRLQGSLRARHSGPSLFPASIELNLLREGQHLQLDLTAEGGTNPPDLTLVAHLALNGQPRGQLLSTLQQSGKEQLWSGELSIPALPEAPWLLQWLGEWQAALPDQAPVPLQSMQLHADWQLRWPQGPLEPARLRQEARGRAGLRVQLPEAWPLPGVGLLQGELAVELAGAQGQWLPRQAEANLRLSQPQGDWLSAIPETLRPQTLQLLLSPVDAQPSTADLPLKLNLHGQGPATIELQAMLQISPRLPDWSIGLNAGEVRLKAPRLTFDDITLTRLDTRLRFSGRIDRQRLQLELGKGSTLGLHHLRRGPAKAPSQSLEQLQGKLAGLQLAASHDGGTLRSLALHGPTRWQVRRLRQAQLKAQGWSLQGNLQAGLEQQKLNGTLRGNQGLGIDLQLGRSADGTLQLDARLQEIVLRAGNPLASTLGAWPERLDLSDGRVQGDARLRLPPKAAPHMTLNLQLSGLAGIYERSELNGLDGRLQVQLQGKSLQFVLPELSLQQLNPGLPLGPLQLRGRYTASLAHPLSGRLDWQQAQLGLLGGRIWLPQGSRDLSGAEQGFALQVQNLQLAELFRAYPAEGLAGQGTLDGYLPVYRGAAGWRIEGGHLSNRGPGALQFRSPKLRALSLSNPAMKLVADALEDFHYSLLAGDLGYDEQGKLLLALRLEGRNPDLEKGRPIHFNINLEEDIPALLTSLQLTDRVSETIRRRVQDSLRKDPDAP